MRGQTSTEYILLVAISLLVALITILGINTYYGILADLSTYVKSYTVNMGVDLRAAKILG